MSAGAVGRILRSANSREIRAYQKDVSVAAKKRENTASVTRKHKFLSRNRENLGAEDLEESLRFQSEKREEWIRELRQRLQRIAEGTSSPARPADSSAASFP